MIRLTQGDMTAIPLAVSYNHRLTDLVVRDDLEGNQEWVWGKKTYGPRRLDGTPIPRVTELLRNNLHNFTGGECLTRAIYNSTVRGNHEFGLQIEPVPDEMREIGDDHLLISGSLELIAITGSDEDASLWDYVSRLGGNWPDLRDILHFPGIECRFVVREAANFSALLHRRWIPYGGEREHTISTRTSSWPHRFDVSEPFLIRRNSSLSAESSSYFHDKIVDPDDGTILLSQMVSETMSLDEMEHWLLEQLKPSEPQRFTRKSMWEDERLTQQADYQDEIRLDDLGIGSVKGVVFGRVKGVPTDEWESKKRETLLDYCHFEAGPREPWIYLMDDVVLNYRGRMLNVKSGMYQLSIEAHTNLNPLNYGLRISDALRRIRVSYVRSRISASSMIEATGPRVKSSHSRRLEKNSGQNFQVGLGNSARRLN